MPGKNKSVTWKERPVEERSSTYRSESSAETAMGRKAAAKSSAPAKSAKTAAKPHPSTARASLGDTPGRNKQHQENAS